MHFEILVEDRSGKKALEILMPKIIGHNHNFRIHAYKGIGKIPGNLKSGVDAGQRQLLNQLSSLLKGYGKTFSNYPPDSPAAVIVVCDLDDKCLKAFRNELFAVLDACPIKPETRFCVAIEECEAWLLGDLRAVKAAYPKAKSSVLDFYVNDNICGTWELLADAVYPGGSAKLKKLGYQASGYEKSKWAEQICPHMDISLNSSDSFNYFRKKLQELAV